MISYLCHSFYKNVFLWSLRGTQEQGLTYFLIKYSDLVGLDWYSEISIFSSSPQPLCHVVKDLAFRNTALWGGILSFETAQMFQLLSISLRCNLVRHAYPQPSEKFRNPWSWACIGSLQVCFLMVKPQSNGKWQSLTQLEESFSTIQNY